MPSRFVEAYELTRRFVRERDAEERLGQLSDQCGMELQLKHMPDNPGGEYVVQRVFGPTETEALVTADIPADAIELLCAKLFDEEHPDYIGR
jgi:hypothetical protein